MTISYIDKRRKETNFVSFRGGRKTCCQVFSSVCKGTTFFRTHQIFLHLILQNSRQALHDKGWLPILADPIVCSVVGCNVLQSLRTAWCLPIVHHYPVCRNHHTTHALLALQRTATSLVYLFWLYPVHYNYERNLYSVLQVLHLFLQQDLFMKCYFGSAKVKIGFMSVANDVAILM